MGDGLSFLEHGAEIGLRRVMADDATPEYLGWLRDPDVNHFLETRFTDHTPESLADYVASMAQSPDSELLAIVRLADGRHIGNIKIGPVERHHGTADVGLMIGDRDAWGRGYGTEAIVLATRFAFRELGVRKLTASCYSGNAGSAAAFLKAGWTEEGRRPAQFVGPDGDTHDQVLFGMLGPS